MKTLFTFLGCFFSILTNAQNEIKISVENKNPGHILYAANSAFCPVSISLDLILDNLGFSKGQQKIFVIPAKAEKFPLGELDIVDPKARSKFSFRFISNLGDVTIINEDTAYEYSLPYEKGKGFRLFQGYNGNFSHQNENALDFTMPEGTEILAAREGTVIRVVQNNAASCPREECKQFNNYVTIYHADGSFAEYAHIKLNGSKVKPGDIVKKGELIAYSGNTGFSNGPHLHFACFLPGLEKRRTITTKFKIGDGNSSTYLKEKETYNKGY